jgi:hypothetical protein
MSFAAGIDLVYRFKSGRGLRLEQHKSADGLREKMSELVFAIPAGPNDGGESPSHSRH